MIQQFQDYLKTEKRYSEHTVNAYITDAKEFGSFLFFEFECEIVDAEFSMARRFIIFLSEKGLSERSINRKISSCKSLYKFLLKNAQVQSNPFLKIAAVKMPKRVGRGIDEIELQNLFKTENFTQDFEGVRDKMILETFYSCGIRRSELINLKFEDFDKSQKTVKVLGKGNKERIIPVTSSYLNALDNYMVSREEIAKSDSSELFLNKNGEKLSTHLVYKVVNKYLSLVSGADKKSPHVLRHSFATHMLNKGADLNTIKELLGHSNLSATQIYTNASIEHLKEIYNQTHPRSHKND
jgi:integrase/recombinase XerC